MLTMRAKDRLELAPALLGSNCAYRRSDLERFGFQSGALLEDSEITLAFHLAGHRVRFAPNVVAYHQVPETVNGYVRQHTRWGRGFIEAARKYLPEIWKKPGLRLPLRVELSIFSLGYLDRIAFMGAGLLTALSIINSRLFPFPRKLFYTALILPWIQIMAVFTEQKANKSMWLRLVYVPVFFLIDIGSALTSLLDGFRKKQPAWGRTERMLLPRSVSTDGIPAREGHVVKAY
jgi:cellulose synthase/poly-beta-1,6-N-acetylglucosamine synthase-like glycosyltransferase